MELWTFWLIVAMCGAVRVAMCGAVRVAMSVQCRSIMALDAVFSSLVIQETNRTAVFFLTR